MKAIPGVCSQTICRPFTRCQRLLFETNLSKEDFRSAVMTGNVGRLNLENFKYTRVPGVEQAVVTNSFGKIIIR